MIWKPKEKELTAEEAIALAKKELTPYWFGSVPRLIGVKGAQGYSALPLDVEFSKKPWLIFIIDPTDFSGEATLTFAREWFKRYGFLQLESLAIFNQTYEFFRSPEPIKGLLEKFQVEFPLAMDHDGGLASAFDAKLLPMVLLLSEGRYFFRHSGKEWLLNTEAEIQNFLRLHDPGLSLLPVIDPEKGDEGASLISTGLVPSKIAKDTSRMEFGYRPKIGEEVAFPHPGFQFSKTAELKLKEPEGASKDEPKYGTKRRAKEADQVAVPTIKAADFSEPRRTKLKPDEFSITGKWIQDAEKIFTSDPNASLAFCSSGSKVSIIAESMSKVGEGTVILCELEAGAAYDTIVGENLILEETGESIVKVNKPHLYHVYVNLPVRQREVILKFPNAEKTPVGIYGVRFGE